MSTPIVTEGDNPISLMAPETEVLSEEVSWQVPEYGRHKVDELMKYLRETTVRAVQSKAQLVRLHISFNDLLVLNDMLEQMDRHLPDFFEG